VVGEHRDNTKSGQDWRLDRADESGPAMRMRMRSGYAVLGATQHLPGYCLLLSDVDGADHLTDLPRPARLVFLTDMALLGEAVLTACRAADPGFLRVNYEVLGNTLHHLHAHVHARYEWEPEQYRVGPVWRYPANLRNAPEYALGPQHDDVRAAIGQELARLTAEAYD
jgi:diadenosine tetraphosphate (Ap4A) HIT family hydrolase